MDRKDPMDLRVKLALQALPAHQVPMEQSVYLEPMESPLWDQLEHPEQRVRSDRPVRSASLDPVDNQASLVNREALEVPESPVVWVRPALRAHRALLALLERREALAQRARPAQREYRAQCQERQV